ncbi:MAG: hypothetical protein IAG13_17690 [Deltaproteobacteria bacterium]|nr:hypothetical protein [Nannocystaceae bacterium]
MAGCNPMMERVDRLYEQWVDFIDDPTARVLRWVVDIDELQVVETFVGVESSDAGQTADLFVRLTLPFVRPDTFALELWNELVVTAKGAEGGALAQWKPPAPSRDGIAALVSACSSLVDYVRRDGLPLDHLVLVLLPSAVSETSAWGTWLETMGAAIADASVRVMVTDDVDAPFVSPRAPTTKIRSVRADLDMAGARLEVSAQAGGLDQPPGAFRHAFTKMLNAIAARDLSTATVVGAEAMKVAAAQGWWQLSVAVLFGLGSGHLTSSPTTAIDFFGRAESLAGAQPQDPSSRTLQIKCRLGMGSCAYQAGAFAKAAELYAATAALARADDDARTELDCRRLASHCFDRAGQTREAWDAGLAAIEVGVRMDRETRESSTLAYAGAQQLELCRRRSYGHYRNGIERTMQELLGPSWQVHGAPSPVAT